MLKVAVIKSTPLPLTIRMDYSSGVVMSHHPVGVACFGAFFTRRRNCSTYVKAGGEAFRLDWAHCVVTMGPLAGKRHDLGKIDVAAGSL